MSRLGRWNISDGSQRVNRSCNDDRTNRLKGKEKHGKTSNKLDYFFSGAVSDEHIYWRKWEWDNIGKKSSIIAANHRTATWATWHDRTWHDISNFTLKFKELLQHSADFQFMHTYVYTITIIKTLRVSVTEKWAWLAERCRHTLGIEKQTWIGNCK